MCVANTHEVIWRGIHCVASDNSDCDEVCGIATSVATGDFDDPDFNFPKRLERLLGVFKAASASCGSTAAPQSQSQPPATPAHVEASVSISSSSESPVVSGGATRVTFTASARSDADSSPPPSPDAAGPDSAIPAESNSQAGGPPPVAVVDPLDDQTQAQVMFQLMNQDGAATTTDSDVGPSTVLGVEVGFESGDPELAITGQVIARAQPTEQARIAQKQINDIMVPLPTKLERCLAGIECDPNVNIGGVAYYMLPSAIRHQVERARKLIGDVQEVERLMDAAGSEFQDLGAKFRCWYDGAACPTGGQ